MTPIPDAAGGAAASTTDTRLGRYDPRKDVAILARVRGDVRIRRATEIGWRPASDVTPLRLGDLVFVGADSQAGLVYVTTRARVSLPSESLLQVEASPPLPAKFKGRYGFGRGSPSERGRLGPSGPSSASESDPSRLGASGIQVYREVEPIPVVSPRGGIEVRAERWPAPFSITLRAPAGRGKVWGYLWDEADEREPVWVGQSAGEFPTILVPRPGRYVFRAVMEDESAASGPVSVRASGIGGGPLRRKSREGDVMVVPP